MGNQKNYAETCKASLTTAGGSFAYYSLPKLTQLGVGKVETLPYSIRVLLEACLRNVDGFVVSNEDVGAIANYDARNVGEVEIPFKPGRVVLQDFTGVPAVVDLAALRSAMRRMGGDPQKVNPLVPCDLVIDHSVQVDAAGTPQALTINGEKEFERNGERYQLLKWAQGAFDNFRVVPPATGIIHQVNLEYLADVVWQQDGVLYPDSLVGTDSHTTMINGLGVVGWGVGGIEAEAVMLGQPVYMLLPEVVGVRLVGHLQPSVTATDVVLRATEMLRAHGVVGKFVEYFGPAMSSLRLADRATLANMAPEYGATMGFFPVDERTIEYLKLSGRDEALIDTVEQYCKAQGLWRTEEAEQAIVYTDVLELDLGTVEPAIAGPKRPQDRIALSNAGDAWNTAIDKVFGKADEADSKTVAVKTGEESFDLHHGSVVLAAITSCTNTSNPSVLIAAGLVARKAVQKGLKSKPWVKTSLAPGSKVVTEYLEKSGLLTDLEALGFHVVGYGCTTCIGNSGPLPDEIRNAIGEGDLVACSVLSGNRNFEGRIGPDIKANYLASPPLVVAYALAGRMDINLTTDPIGQTEDGTDVMLSDIWPTPEEITAAIEQFVTRSQFVEQYADVFAGSADWKAIDAGSGDLYKWDEASTYVQEPPFFVDLTLKPEPIGAISSARCLIKVADSVTTDHISPAGVIPPDGPAGQYLIEHEVPIAMFNSFGSRRGNDRVMTRGTFANIRVRNQLAPGTEGGWTTDLLDGKVKSIYEASCHYKDESIPLVVLAGKDYGMGSSRDWAAKGTYLLGVKAVLAESFERIHRSNLVGMGVLPLTFKPGENSESLGLDGTETFEIQVDDTLTPRQDVMVVATATNGTPKTFTTTCRIDTPVEVEYYRNGGILHTVLRKMARTE
ncbi:MAG: aconitate hydratase AcnA [Planctomycetes bacterium]|nr:aconitate hydratase AcnA [Planctomycetota bacterium]NOG53893.1 aconitate hydratase AcnA [Planctomycetota bacterium]